MWIDALTVFWFNNAHACSFHIIDALTVFCFIAEEKPGRPERPALPTSYEQLWLLHAERIPAVDSNSLMLHRLSMYSFSRAKSLAEMSARIFIKSFSARFVNAYIRTHGNDNA